MIHNLAHPKEKIALWPNYIFVYNYRDWPYDKKAMIDCIRSEEALQKKAYPHPIFGLIRLDEWVPFIGYHEKRHLEQIEEIKAKL